MIKIVICKSRLLIDVGMFDIDIINDIIGCCKGTGCRVYRHCEYIRVYCDLNKLYNCLFALSCKYALVIN